MGDFRQIRPLGALLHVGELETQGRYAAFGQPARDGRHECVVHACARAVGEHIAGPRIGRDVEQAGGRATGGQRNREALHQMCSACPSARNAVSCTASPSVGWAWIVPPTSSSRAPISIDCENAALSSDNAAAHGLPADDQVVVAPRHHAHETVARFELMARPLAANGKQRA